jgi:hypothetical protein
MNIPPERLEKCTEEIIAFLHHVYVLMRDGELDKLQIDPFYERASIIDDTIVMNVINTLEGLFKNELERYPEYHRRAQGVSTSTILKPPGFDKLPKDKQRAVVLGIDRICSEYRETPEEEAARKRREAHMMSYWRPVSSESDWPPQTEPQPARIDESDWPPRPPQTEPQINESDINESDWPPQTPPQYYEVGD